MNNPDIDIILRTVAEARRILDQAGPVDRMLTIDRLRDVLNRDDFVKAVDRMNIRRRMIRVVDD
jgi:hypothetical protein